jgi:predicted nucleic acid-binding protein
VIVLDTSVLSLVFRRRGPSDQEPWPVAELRKLIAEDAPLAVPGIILQELLSGVRSSEQFRKLQGAMAGFPILLANESHHLRAAQISNACRRQGVACSTIDALIATLTIAVDGQLLTTDADFARIAPHCGMKLCGLPRESR